MKKNLKKSIAIAIAVCMFAAMLSLPMLSFADTWDGASVSDGLAGSGTEEDPFIIATAADFAYFADQSRAEEHFEDQYVKLDDDISLGDIEIAPLGEFKGIFDGNGHEISGININTTSDNVALFSSIAGGAIKDLTLAGSITSTGAYVGGFAGYVLSASFDNCVNNIDVTGRGKVGGICGSVISGGNAEIIYCKNNGTITATNEANYSFLGGLIGEIQKDATSYATVSIICSENAGSVVSRTRTVAAGLVGQNRGDLTIKNCINSGTVTAATQIGGIVANVNNDAIALTVENTINVGTLRTIRTTGATAHIGAILGYYAEKANSETFENAFYRNSDYDFNGANDGQTANTPRGTAMDTASDWTDGTIVALLNGDAEEPVFEQGENYPVLIVKKDSGDECAHVPSGWILDKEATTEEAGLKHKECTICGAILEEEVIDKIEMPNIEPGEGVPEIEV
ncbi:MAG: hypothetical protein J5852_05275, partial [Clostridia bacterium]|nr:hypothetical protein [Clostridia bacterium]